MQIKCQYKILFGDKYLKQYLIEFTYRVYKVTYNVYQLLFTNLNMLDSIWIVKTHFSMLPPPTQNLVKKQFLLLLMSLNIQGILACVKLLTMFV